MGLKIYCKTTKIEVEKRFFQMWVVF